MAKYRKRNAVVEAVQFDPKQTPWPDYIVPWSPAIPSELNRLGWVEAKVPGVGRLSVSPGQWVVTDEDGDRSVWDNEAFKAAYEVVV